MASLRDSSKRVEPLEDASTLPTVAILAEARLRVPRLIVGHLLALSPLERFVLSKVDGDLDVEHVAEGIALSIDEVVAIFLGLSARGAVRLDVPRPTERRSTSFIRTRVHRPDVEEDVVQLDDGDLVEIAPETVEVPRATDSSPPFSRSTQLRTTLPISSPVAVPRPSKR